ncbi:hypothetical protein TNCV_4953951 [Trichonephila clavipes]|nr:hypothetical protein TNCV_4953951 [Trichonephila clavipes]
MPYLSRTSSIKVMAHSLAVALGSASGRGSRVFDPLGGTILNDEDPSFAIFTLSQDSSLQEGTEIGGLFLVLMWCSKIFVASPPGSKTFWKDSNRRLSFSFWGEVKLSPSPSLNWQVLLDISAMDGVSNSSPNGYLWVGLSQKYQQVFFTSRTKPAELR